MLPPTGRKECYGLIQDIHMMKCRKDQAFRIDGLGANYILAMSEAAPAHHPLVPS